MGTLLLILAIVFFVAGVVVMVLTGFLGFLYYVPLFLAGVLCFFLHNKLS